MRIALFGRSASKLNKDFFKLLLKSVEEVGAHLILHKEFAAKLEKAGLTVDGIDLFEEGRDLKDKVDCLFSIGGDGTLLNTTPLVRDSGIPILGINTGRLGFLSSIQTEELSDALNTIARKEYLVDKRTLLQLNTENDLFGDQNYALNECTVIKKDTSSMVSIDVHLNEQYLNTYWADGLIISTPTGTTAYSLSCGGPIVMPGSGNFTITPIAPHNLNVRPIVIPDSSKISLRLTGRTKNHLVSLDSRAVSIGQEEVLEVSKSEFTINLIRMKDYSFFNTLRSKLNWGLDRRNR